MLPLHLMSLHEISKREERTMALCVKKPNSTRPWDDQTATTAASPSTSTPPSNTGTSYGCKSFDSLGRLLRRLCREFNFDNVDDKARTCQYPTATLYFCARTGLQQCRTGLSDDVSTASELCYGRRNGNICINDRFRYGIHGSEAKPQQKWLRLRKYWRHNARRRLRKIERDQRLQQLPVDSRNAEETPTNVARTDHGFQNKFANNHTNDNIFRRNSCKDSEELLWRRIRFVKFCSNQSYQQQQYNLQQTKLRSIKEYNSLGEQLQLSTRTIFQHLNETPQGQSNNVTAKSSEIPTRSSISILFVITKSRDQLSDELYTDTAGGHSRRKTTCYSMSPLFLARSKKFLPTKTSTRMSKRTRPSVCLLQSTTLESHHRNGNSTASISKSKDEPISRRKFTKRCQLNIFRKFEPGRHFQHTEIKLRPVCTNFRISYH